eukprot:3298407-Prorocentrum_lima.AAC.1
MEDVQWQTNRATEIHSSQTYIHTRTITYYDIGLVASQDTFFNRKGKSRKGTSESRGERKNPIGPDGTVKKIGSMSMGT